MLIDTHVHLNNDDLGRASDLPGVLARAEAEGVTQFIVVGFDRKSSERAVALSESDPRIYAVVGVHPHDASHWNDETADHLRTWSKNPRVLAIGEIGLDFYRDLSPRPAQYEAFRAQLRLAIEVNLPVVIHCRDAYDETLALLEDEAGDIPGLILHCFAGDAGHAERVFAKGWYIGVDGPVTYKKSDALRAIVRDAPQSQLLIETDAPYLSPEPFRGKFPNEPARVALVAQKIAEVRGETFEEVAAYTTTNARRAFLRL